MDKYGACWQNNTSDLKIERACIRQGGRWVDEDGKECGLGLFYHHKEFQKLVWPWKAWHKWNDLLLRELTQNTITGVLGPASSGKTHEVGAFILCDWWCFPENTTALVSSTTLQLLDLRIWGEIKKLFKDAKERYPWLPGHINESKYRISHQPKTEAVRDFRNGIQGIACNKGTTFVGLSNYAGIKNERMRIAGDECFVAGTLVDTELGPVPIESVEVGQRVVSANGIGVVDGISVSTSKRLVKLTMKSGAVITCTPGHPFFSNYGWIKACELNQDHYILSANEAMRILRGDFSSQRQCQGVRTVPYHHSESDVQVLRSSVRGSGYSPGKDFLLQTLLSEMENGATGIQRENLHQGSWSQEECRQDYLAQKQPRKIEGDHGQDAQFNAGTACEKVIEFEYRNEVQRASPEDSRGKWDRTYPRRKMFIGGDPVIQFEPSDHDRATCRIGIPDVLQSRLGDSIHKAGNRSGRSEPLDVLSQRAGREENQILAGDWVDRVEIQKQENLDGDTGGDSGTAVYNLQIDVHPSYSVNGLLVHNCQFMPPKWIEAFNNLSHTPKDFKAIGMGNPKDPMDALGVLCEPSAGWDSADRSEKTKTWNAKLPGARVVQLVGTDSPNYDYEDGNEKYPYLIKRKEVENHRKYYGPNSIQYSMMDLGMMPLGGVSNRVITRQMCEQHHAMDEPIFQGSVTKIFGLDAAYGTLGGDRCVGGEFWFGKSVDGIETFALHGQPIIIPVNFKNRESAETQIAVYVRKECQARGITPEHVYFDSTGRGSLGTAFGRLWSTAVNPVEFGGKASDRPTSVVDKRPCHASYGKFVTELWYSARLVIEAGQMRGLTDEVVEEGQLREYMMIDNKRVDVETKEKTKERMKRSPDLFDMLVVGLEGARRLGFQIASIGSTVKSGPTIWRDAYQKRLSLNRQQRLVYA